MLYRKTYDDKLMIVGEIFDMFDYDEKVTSEYFEQQEEISEIIHYQKISFLIMLINIK